MSAVTTEMQFLYTYVGLLYASTENIEYYESHIAGTTEPNKAG
jgi:hypothetical protein